VSADSSCNAVDYVDPRLFHREDGEGCEAEKPAENQLGAASVPQQVCKLG